MPAGCRDFEPFCASKIKGITCRTSVEEETMSSNVRTTICGRAAQWMMLAAWAWPQLAMAEAPSLYWY